MSPDLREGQAFGAYRVTGVAGTGGMGVVYRAEQRPLGRTVALKVIRQEIAQSADYRARFLREARLAAAVDHPGIVSVFDFGEQAGRLYLAMQWVDGADLQHLIDRGRLDPARAVNIGTQMAAALDAIHAAGMLHRDVKPANILVRDIGGEDHAYLTDFGIAKITGAQGGLTRTGWMVGTSGYLAPEQIRGRQPDARSDLYALGCVMFAALTGQRPFAGANDQELLWAHASGPRPVASLVCPGLGGRYDEFLIRALAVDPRDRFQSGREFAAELESAHRGRPAAATVTARVPRQAGPAAGSGARGAKAARPHPGGRPRRVAGRLTAAAGSLAFLASVTVLHTYSNNGTGWKSMWEATHGDPASPLYAKDFWISAGLAAFVLIGIAAAAGARTRLPTAVVAAAALGLAGYTLYIPTIGASPGFGPFGTSYWLSLAAAALMTLGTVAAAIRPSARSAQAGRRRGR